jgi:hypothetical protein
MTLGGRDKHTHPHGRAERNTRSCTAGSRRVTTRAAAARQVGLQRRGYATPRSRTAGFPQGDDASGGSPQVGAAAARLRRGGASARWPTTAGAERPRRFGEPCGIRSPLGLRLSLAALHQLATDTRRAALTAGPDQQMA